MKEPPSVEIALEDSTALEGSSLRRLKHEATIRYNLLPPSDRIYIRGLPRDACVFTCCSLDVCLIQLLQFLANIYNAAFSLIF